MAITTTERHFVQVHKASPKTKMPSKEGNKVRRQHQQKVPSPKNKTPAISDWGSAGSLVFSAYFCDCTVISLYPCMHAVNLKCTLRTAQMNKRPSTQASALRSSTLTFSRPMCTSRPIML